MLFSCAAIPFIVHPIDNGIHALMNLSLRPAMRKYVCGQGQGSLAGLEICGSDDCIPVEAGKNTFGIGLLGATPARLALYKA